MCIRDSIYVTRKTCLLSHAKQEVSTDKLLARRIWFCGRNVERTCCYHDNKLATEAHNKRQASFEFASLHLCLQQGLQFVHSKSTDMVISEGGVMVSLLSPCYTTLNNSTRYKYKLFFFAPPDCTCYSTWTWNEWENKGHWEISVLGHSMNA